jgi:hypothetical protein
MKRKWTRKSNHKSLLQLVKQESEFAYFFHSRLPELTGNWRSTCGAVIRHSPADSLSKIELYNTVLRDPVRSCQSKIPIDKEKPQKFHLFC